MLRVASSDAPEVGVIGDGVPPAGGTRDERLRHARRVDWRFLLSSPDLGRMALGGTPDAALRDALVAVTRMPATGLPTSAASTAPAETAAIGGEGPLPEFDTVVLSGHVSRSALVEAAGSVAPGGHLIVEIDGLLSPLVAGRRGAAPGTAARLGRSLAAGGFHVRLWWAWPAIGRTTTFAPLDDAIAIRELVARRFGGRRGAPVAAVLARLAGTSALSVFATAVVIVARRGAAGDGLIEGRLRPVTGSAATRPVGLLVLAPRYRASAHVVGLGLAPGGAVERVAKVARLRDDTSLAHEAAVLGALGRAHGASGSGPALLNAPGDRTAVGEDPWPILAETGLAGTPLDPATVRADRDGVVRDIERWLAGLPVGESASRSFGVVPRIEAALAAVERLAGDSPAGRVLGELVRRTRPLVTRLANASLARVFEHGDPAHPNLLRLADGRVGAVDWERGEPDGLPLHDLTIALAYVAAAARRATSGPDQAAAFHAAMTGPDPWAADALDRAADRVGCDRGLRPALVVAAWLRSAGWLAEHLAGSNADPAGIASAADPAPYDAARSSRDDLARWLAADRSVALWAVALELAGAD